VFLLPREDAEPTTDRMKVKKKPYPLMSFSNTEFLEKELSPFTTASPKILATAMLELMMVKKKMKKKPQLKMMEKKKMEMPLKKNNAVESGLNHSEAKLPTSPTTVNPNLTNSNLFH